MPFIKDLISFLNESWARYAVIQHSHAIYLVYSIL